jgi:hypothetical protein
MKLHARQRWLVVAGLLTATLAAAAWIRDGAVPSRTEVVAASDSSAAPASRQSDAGTDGEAPVINLEKLKSRSLGKVIRDPFATGAPRAAKSKPSAAAPSAQVAVAPPPSPPPPSAPPLPFTYMGKLVQGGDLAVFLVQGERNLIVHEGDTIDSLYKVERIAEGGITLLFLPLNQRQTIIIGEPQ